MTRLRAVTIVLFHVGHGLSKFGTIFIPHFFVHLGHYLCGQLKAIDDFVFPLVDQDSIL